MILANLVGFSYGVAGLWTFVETIATWDGLIILTKCLMVLIIATHFMLGLRQHEVNKYGLYAAKNF